MSKLISRMRDLILFGLLLILLKVAMDRKQANQPQTGQILSAVAEQLEPESFAQEQDSQDNQDEQLEQIEEPQNEPEAEPIEFSMPEQQEPEPAQEIPADEPKKNTLEALKT